MLKVNIIIATYNRALMLKKALKSILEQKTDESFIFDVLVIDNNSSDATKNIVEEMMPQFQGKLQYIFEAIQGKSYALNSGINLSVGDILVFTDDDIIADEHWLLNIVNCFKETGCDGLGGIIKPSYRPNTPRWIKDNADLLVGPIVYYNYGPKNILYQKPMYEFLGANFAFKKSLFIDCGLFRTDIGPGNDKLGEDTEITKRFLKANKKLYYCGSATVWHPVEKYRMSWGYIIKWYFSLGKYRVIVDEQKRIPNAVYIGGVPRYLIAETLKKSFLLIINVFNRRIFLKTLIDLSIDLGKASEIKRIYQLK